MQGAGATHRAIEAVWKIESAKVIAVVARSLGGDIGLAEEAAQEALVAALEQWPGAGIPENAGAWLVATARNRAIDTARREERFRGVREELAREARAREARNGGLDQAGVDRMLDGEVEDDLLRLVFTTCHPVLSSDARTALTLRLLCGLTTGEIARAFLTSEETIAQRIVRAKRTLAESGVPFEVPAGRELRERLASVLEVIYLMFNEGYSATVGDDWMRPALCEEAIRLGRVLCGLMEGDGEVQGLTALMEIQASRAGARVDATGKPVLLLDQNRAIWDRLLIRRGLAALEKAEQRGERGTYTIQASIAACHARALRAEETDWERIAGLYGELAKVAPSPVVELNRAVAVGMAQGATQGLEIVDGLVEEGALRGYYLLHAVRGDLLAKSGRGEEARGEFLRAAELTGNAREREVLEGRARKG